MFGILLILLLFCGLCPLRAQEPITVESYRDAVLRYDYDMKIAERLSESSFRDMRRTQAGFLPQLSASAGFEADFRRSRTDAGLAKPYSFNVQPTVSQTVYAGGKVRNAYRRAQTDYEISLCSASDAGLQTVYAAEYGYWNLAADIALLEAARRYVGIIESLLGVVDSRFEDGYISKSDVLMVRARKNEAQYSLRTQERIYFSSLHDFNIRMGSDPSAAVALADSILTWVRLPVRRSVDEILRSRPDYMAARLQIRGREYDVHLAGADFYPSVSAGVTGVWNTLSPNLTGSTRVDGYAFVRLSVPIFGWGQRRNSILSASALAESARLEMLRLEDEIARQESDAWSVIVESAMQLRQSYDGLSIAAENLSLSTFAYNEGQLTVLDVLSAQLSWIQIYTNTISAARALRLAIADYRRIAAVQPDIHPSAAVGTAN